MDINNLELIAKQIGIPITSIILGYVLIKWLYSCVNRYISSKVNFELNCKLSEINKNHSIDLINIERKVQESLNNQNHKLDMVLEKQKSTYELLNTKYSLLKQEKIVAYKSFYGKLLLSVYDLKALCEYKCNSRLGYGYDDIIIENLRKKNVDSSFINKLKELQKSGIQYAQKFLEQIERLYYYNKLIESYDVQRAYFNENNMFFTEAFIEKIEDLYDIVDPIIEYELMLCKGQEDIANTFIRYKKHDQLIGIIIVIYDRLTMIKNEIKHDLEDN